MNTTRYTDANFGSELERAVGASSLFDTVIEERTRAIIEAVRTRGDEALVEFTQRFDKATLTPEQEHQSIRLEQVNRR